MANKKNVLETIREDDFVEYFLFPPIDTLDEKQQETLLARFSNQITSVVKKHTKQYIWHKDEFQLSSRTSITRQLVIDADGQTEYLPPHLHGVTHVGDNIEDEWFIVFLLRELTKAIQGLIVRVYDSDGEFLLIEAADFLPPWANPEICENRVYLMNGSIHIIPLEDEDVLSEEQMAVNEALSMLRDQTSESLASPEIQNAINSKLEGYPGKIKDNIHNATVYVPIAIAAILKHRPNLIAPAVQAFCNRDPIDLKACRAMKYFPPEGRVSVRVTFTKYLYAMLVHSKYAPDKRTGWNLPCSTSPQFKAHSLGVKIACGFEILAAQARPSPDLDDDKGFLKYVQNLCEKNYFRGLLEHSKEHTELLNKAKDYYKSHRDSMHTAPIFGREILKLISTLDFKEEELRKEEPDLSLDDDESWLNITPEELDKMLQEKYGHRKYTTITSDSNASEFTKKVSQFLENVSDFDGVEHPLEDPIRPPRGSKKKNKVSFSDDTKNNDRQPPIPNNSNRINFQPDGFACAVQNILNFVIPEDDSWNLESDSDMSDYAEDNYVNEESYQEVKTKMQKYMDEMDRELAKTTIGESFEKKAEESFDDIENFTPVDIDMNALKNILESYKSQMGEAGPSSNMLGPMGLHLDTTEKK